MVATKILYYTLGKAIIDTESALAEYMTDDSQQYDSSTSFVISTMAWIR